MYHVVIIDDEPIIVEGISKLVPWEKYGCCVTACAYGGKEGLCYHPGEEAGYYFYGYFHARTGRAENDRSFGNPEFQVMRSAFLPVSGF